MLFRVSFACFAIVGCFLVSEAADIRSQQPHGNNWALIVCTSRYWFNYRHVANALSIYQSVKQLGIPDHQIILMLADDMACNSRNPYRGTVYGSAERSSSLYDENVEVDYRGEEVTVDSFLRVLTGRHTSETALSKRLNTDKNSNILLYMTGHGGDEFLKFQDTEEMCSQDIANAFHDMNVRERYREILFISDTCQAGSLCNSLNSPNVVCLASSATGENSYGHHGDRDIGVTLMDKFTAATAEFFETVQRQSAKPGTIGSQITLDTLLKYYNPQHLRSTPTLNVAHYNRRLQDVPVADFFGSVSDAVLTHDVYKLNFDFSDL